jgi:hypothetical protein
MDTYTIIIQTLFKSKDLTYLSGTNYLEILKKYYTVLFKDYCSKNTVYIDEMKYVEFICIRIIYLSLSLDEMSSNYRFNELPHSEINHLVRNSWYTRKLIDYEYSVLDHCNWNPLRYCSEILKDEIELLDSDLYGSNNKFDVT